MRAPLPTLLLSLAIAVGLGGAARALEEAPEPTHQQWPFEGVFGTYDTAASQRGFQVYKEVCFFFFKQKTAYEMFILLVTGKTDRADLEMALDAGANDYLTKPIDLSLLNVRLA